MNKKQPRQYRRGCVFYIIFYTLFLCHLFTLVKTVIY
jgi:hypothetical protein